MEIKEAYKKAKRILNSVEGINFIEFTFNGVECNVCRYDGDNIDDFVRSYHKELNLQSEK